MKLKYYLRGLGAGILFATIVLFISYSYKMSDGQIKKRAEELGMVYAGKEEQTTADIDNESTGGNGETGDKASSEETESTNIAGQTSTNEPTSDNKEETTTPEPTTPEPTTEATTPEPTTPNEKVEKCELTVTGSTSSNDVAYALANAGIIEDAEEFNDYLCDNGYDRRIQNGTYTITSDMSYEDIAKLITTRNY